MSGSFFGPASIQHREGVFGRFYRTHSALLLLILLTAVLLQLNGWWLPTRDGASYLSIARSIFTNDGPRNLGSSHLYYQLGYPYLISPLFRLRTNPFLLISIAHGVMALLTLWGIRAWASSLLGRRPGLIITLLTGCNGAFLYYTRTFLSEMPAMLWMILAVLALNQALKARPGRQLAFYVVFSAALVLVATITRYASICLIAGLVVSGLLQVWKHRISLARLMLVCVATGFPALAAILTLVHHDARMAAAAGSSPTYLDNMRFQQFSLLQQLLESARLRISEVGRLLIPGMLHTHTGQGDWLNINTLLYLTVFVVLALGWWKLARSTGDIFACTLPFYFALYLAWPWDAGFRFLSPMLPVLWASVWMLLIARRRWRYSLLSILLGAHLAAAFGIQASETFKESRQWQRLWKPCQQFAAHAPASQHWATRAIAANDTQLWLSYLIDHPVAKIDARSPVPASVTTLVQLQSTDTPAGFTLTQRAGELVLLQRKE